MKNAYDVALLAALTATMPEVWPEETRRANGVVAWLRMRGFVPVALEITRTAYVIRLAGTDDSVVVSVNVERSERQ